MALGDYEFLLHKLRIVTYGPEYKMALTCPYCGKEFETTADLEQLER
jgi:wobble nucleotide-excising tRNase